MADGFYQLSGSVYYRLNTAWGYEQDNIATKYYNDATEAPYRASYPIIFPQEIKYWDLTNRYTGYYVENQQAKTVYDAKLQFGKYPPSLYVTKRGSWNNFTCVLRMVNPYPIPIKVCWDGAFQYEWEDPNKGYVVSEHNISGSKDIQYNDDESWLIIDSSSLYISFWLKIWYAPVDGMKEYNSQKYLYEWDIDSDRVTYEPADEEDTTTT